jgi:hypothetical protein
MKLKRGVYHATSSADVRDTEAYAMGRRWLRHRRDKRAKEPFAVFMWFHTF